ncbi:MAG: DNA cytosine methyltransferase [Planctomycetes bacterium]|nr:DNA cytosine methyltransferase [Planctomycetota bacterium]
MGRIDLLIAGPPCQGHSDLNNHSRRLDARNSLYARVARAADVLQAPVVIIENVLGVTRDRGRVVPRVANLLSSRGYAYRNRMHRCLRRRRSSTKKTTLCHRLLSSVQHAWTSIPKWRGLRLKLRHVLSGIEDEPSTSPTTFTTPSKSSERNTSRIAYLFAKRAYELPDSERPPCHRDFAHSYNAVYGRLRWDGVANTITSGFGSMGQGRYVHPTKRRLITPHEAARIQGFPDWFRFDSVKSRGALQTIIGNAVVPRVAAHLVAYLIERGILRPLPALPEGIQSRWGRL